jgi:hypothetical protein
MFSETLNLHRVMLVPSRFLETVTTVDSLTSSSSNLLCHVFLQQHCSFLHTQWKSYTFPFFIIIQFLTFHSLSTTHTISRSLALSPILTLNLSHYFQPTFSLSPSHSLILCLTLSVSPSQSHSLSLTLSVLLSQSHPLSLTLSFSLSHSHSLSLTLSFSLSHSHSLILTLSFSLSHSHPLILTLSLSVSFLLSFYLTLCLSVDYLHASL